MSSNDAVRTLQLRRYELVPGSIDDFIAWFTSTVVPAREALGFRIEFALADREANEFVWAVSTPGNEEAFRARETRYLDSGERAAAFAGEPQRVAVYHVRFAEVIL